MDWITSDTHFCHKNIITYCSRPFADVIQMNNCMISNWNAVVKPGDRIFHLGDFAFAPFSKIKEIREQLNGSITLILGNHDQEIKNNYKESLRFFDGISDYKELKKDGKKIVLCHYPFSVWNQNYRGAINLFGHTHQTIKTTNLPNQFHVGVDSWDFKPVSLETILSMAVPIKPFNDQEE